MKEKKLNGLIVSCQATEGEPFFNKNLMGIMAHAVCLGGATAIRTSGVSDIIDVKKHVNVPVIGLIKKKYHDSAIYITPTLQDVRDICSAGADVVAIDMTDRERPNGEKIEHILHAIKNEFPHVEIMADIATRKEALNADKLGVDYVSTTLRSYTESTKGIKIPDYEMIAEIFGQLKNSKLVAEGGIWEAEQLKRILQIGVDTVVIGSSITRPKDITERFNCVFKGA